MITNERGILRLLKASRPGRLHVIDPYKVTERRRTARGGRVIRG